MKPVTLFLARGPEEAATIYPLLTLKATPVSIDPSVNQVAATAQQPQKATERKGLRLNVKRLYRIDLRGQISEVQQGLLPYIAA